MDGTAMWTANRSLERTNDAMKDRLCTKDMDAKVAVRLSPCLAVANCILAAIHEDAFSIAGGKVDVQVEQAEDAEERLQSHVDRLIQLL